VADIFEAPPNEISSSTYCWKNIPLFII
jgi:hypothetical protein